MRRPLTSPASSRARASVAPQSLAPPRVSRLDASPCDLLHPIPLPRIDQEVAAEALAFAFASGEAEGLGRIVDRVATAPSTFERRDYEQDLFLSEFVRKCLPIVARGRERKPSVSHLLSLVCSPPEDAAVTAFRQEVLSELAGSEALRRRVENLYVWLRQFRDLIGRPALGAQEGIERRLSVLSSVRAVIESLASGFEDTTSGLRRLGEYGSRVAQEPGYRRMCELLDYEKNRAEVDLRISVGFDGRVRSFQTLERRPNRSNAFYSTPLGRLWSRLGLWIRGYRTGSAEILSRLVDSVFSGLEPKIVFFFTLIGDLEFYLAGLGFRDRAEAAGLSVCLPRFEDRQGRNYSDLFNPWLVSEDRSCVPCTLRFDESDHIVFVTGPNSGGKTRLLQALSLCQLLGQCGLFVPAREARLQRVPGLFASLIERAEVDQNEGRLGTELMRIRRMFEHLRVGSMVVVDELCSGTNPSEGEALMRLVLEVLSRLGPQAYVATHFLEFTAGLQKVASGYRYLQTQLDERECPTYAFVAGVATTSLAHRVAERLGVTRESLWHLIAENNPELRRALGGGAVDPDSEQGEESAGSAR